MNTDRITNTLEALKKIVWSDSSPLNHIEEVLVLSIHKDLMTKSYITKPQLQQVQALILKIKASERPTRPKPYFINGEIRFPINTPMRYRYWSKGQSVKDTIEEIKNS